MKRILTALSIAVFAASTMIASTAAQAGFKGRLAVGLAVGALAVMHNQHRYEQRKRAQKRIYARRKTEKVYVAKKARSQPAEQEVAKVEEPEVKAPEVAAVNENSSITTAALSPEQAPQDAAETTDETAAVEPVAVEPEEKSAEAADAKEKPTETAKAVKGLDCKKFFSSVGLTLSVPCE